MSNELTPAEVIAVKLLGWSLRPDAGDQKCYEHLSGSVHFVGGELDGCGMGQCGGEDFPDFTDERLAWYWIDQVQRELAARGLIYGTPSDPSYARELRRIVGGDSCDPMIYLLATPAQRLEAAIRVIEESGL